MSATRRNGFTLVELIVTIGIVVTLTGVVVPIIAKVQDSASRAHCASNLRQIGVALNVYRTSENGSLPYRPSGLDQTNPHVFKYKDQPASIARTMERLAGSKDIYYCPGNYQQRTPSEWWPFSSGTVAATYQFPFLLKQSLWLTSRPDYRCIRSDTVLAADYLGSDSDPTAPLAWNHKLGGNGSPVGMNMLLGDGHVEWRTSDGEWVLWGRSNGPLNWYWAK